MFNGELNARLITDCCGGNFKSNVFAGNERIMNQVKTTTTLDLSRVELCSRSQQEHCSLESNLII